jgi:hypothetical protein
MKVFKKETILDIRDKIFYLLQQSVVPLLLLAPRSRMNVVFRKQA